MIYIFKKLELGKPVRQSFNFQFYGFTLLSDIILKRFEYDLANIELRLKLKLKFIFISKNSEEFHLKLCYMKFIVIFVQGFSEGI